MTQTQKQDDAYGVLTELEPTQKHVGLYVLYKELSMVSEQFNVIEPIRYRTEHFSYDPTVSHSTSSSAPSVDTWSSLTSAPKLYYILGGGGLLLLLLLAAGICCCKWLTDTFEIYRRGVRNDPTGIDGKG